MRARLLAALASAFALSACASLGALARIVQPPTFEQAAGQPAEVRLLTPSVADPRGGANIRLWLSVRNPNPFGFRLSTLDTTLYLEGARAAVGEFPLGLPLGARQESVIPLDLTVSFADMPNLANAVRRAATGRALAYRLDGTVGIDAGRLGTPTFGPMLLIEGELRHMVDSTSDWATVCRWTDANFLRVPSAQLSAQHCRTISILM